MEINKTIQQRRLQLKLLDTDVAKKVGLSVHEYGDVESHADELITAVPFGNVKLLINVLELDICTLLRIPKESLANSAQTPAELVKSSRERLGYSISHVANLIGFQDAAIESLERKPAFADTLVIKTLEDIEAVLKLNKGDLVLAAYREQQPLNGHNASKKPQP